MNDFEKTCYAGKTQVGDCLSLGPLVYHDYPLRLLNLLDDPIQECGLYIYQRILLTSDFRKQKLARGNLETDRETGTEMERRQRWPSLATACER